MHLFRNSFHFLEATPIEVHEKVFGSLHTDFYTIFPAFIDAITSQTSSRGNQSVAIRTSQEMVLKKAAAAI